MKYLFSKFKLRIDIFEILKIPPKNWQKKLKIENTEQSLSILLLFEFLHRDLLILIWKIIQTWRF